jgi:hypothetical protein
MIESEGQDILLEPLKEYFGMKLVVFYLIFGFTITLSCECSKPQNLLYRRNSSTMAFKGRVVSNDLDSTKETRVMKFSVSKIWYKGKVEEAKFITVKSDVWGIACGTRIPLDSNAIVFCSSRSENGSQEFWTSSCSENIISPSKEEIDSLWSEAVEKRSN